MPKVDTLSFIVWIATAAAYALLAALIVRRSTVRRWLWLFLFALISATFGGALLAVYRASMPAVYFWGYWTERFALGICEFGIVWQVSCSLLAAKRWRRRLCKATLLFIVLALVTSAVMTAVSPLPRYVAAMQVTSSIDRLMSLAACILFVLTAFTFDAIGIRWRRQTLLVGIGMAIQGALFTSFAWYISMRPLSQEQMALPSLIRDILELATITLWISAFAPTPLPDSYAAISADAMESSINSIKRRNF